MMSDKPLKVIAGTPDKPLVIGDIEIDCYVLEDETRVLSQRGMASGLGMSSTSGHRLTRFINSKNLKPFISNELRLVIESPIQFEFEGRTASGYPATLLVSLCNVVLEARTEEALQKQQAHIAERSELLLRGLATVGIIALVDEATGYQRIREERALVTILEKYISGELQPWTKTFPFEFYDGIVKLKNWPSIYALKRPSVVGKYTNNIVYERITDGLYQELKKRNPALPGGYRKHKHHQWFTPEYGHPRLQEHIASVSALMRAAANWNTFYERLLPRAFPRKREQMPLALDD